MIKLLNSIVDDKRRLIGFIAEGKDKEFDGFTDEKIQKPVRLSWLADRNFKNNQVAVSNNGIQQLANFKINELPMVAITPDGYVNVDNSMKLIGRYMSNNKVVGFDVELAGDKARYTYKNVIDLSFWFKPENFIVKTSSTGKMFITGKPGVKLGDLPTEVIGEKSKAKRPRSGATAPTSVDGHIDNVFDIMDLYSYIQSLNGQVLMLPTEKYVRTGTATTAAASTFIEMGIGEVASPFIEVGETKLNANTNFKKPGMVNVPAGGGSIPVQTFVYRKKTIFRNGDNHIKKFGVVIPKSKSDEFVQAFSKGMVITPITDNNITQPFSALIGRNDVDFFEVDATKVDMFSKDKIKNSILTNKQIYELTDSLYRDKLIAKYLGTRAGLLKELKNAGVMIEEASGRQIMPMFAAMNDEFRNSLEACGIDLYTGSFTDTQPVDRSSKSKGDKKIDDTVSIQYAIDGKDAGKITYKMMDNGSDKVPADILKLVETFKNIADDAEKARKARELLRKTEKHMDEIKLKLWMHKCAMFIEGKYEKIHTHNKTQWALNTKKRTKAKFYNCLDPQAEGLMVGLENVDI